MHLTDLEIRAAIVEPKAFGEPLRAIASYEGAPETCVALELSALTFVRPGELRAVEGAEFDLDKAAWTISARSRRHGLMGSRIASIDDLPIAAVDRHFRCEESVRAPICDGGVPHSQHIDPALLAQWAA
ncbi:MAG TPA: hypothetical protein VIF40_12005 [Methylosinus sp.]|jgi:integrase|uniref:hypothetical protein n=1 Tax=Methylosinus sp. TaxID=427 RepID=UPI002F93ABB4